MHKTADIYGEMKTSSGMAQNKWENIKHPPPTATMALDL